MSSSDLPKMPADVLAILNALPNSCLLLLPDAPRFTIAGASDSYLANTYLKREKAIDHGVFEMLTDNPNNLEATGVKNLTASLNYVLEHKREHRMANQRYDIYNPATGKWEHRIWRPLNKPVLDAGQNIQYIIHWVEDVTEQLRFQEETEKQKRLYEAITNNTPDLLYVFDLNYRFAYANAALLTMWGKTKEEAFGQGLRALGYEEWHARMHEEEIDQIVATRKPVRGVVAFPHAELGERIYDYLLVPVLNEKGETEAVAGSTRDITEIKQAEIVLEDKVKERTQELEELNRELMRSNANLEEFAHASSHDLKEPIRKIYFFTQHLKDQLGTRLSEGELRSFNRIESATQRMSTLIDDLLLYSYVSQRPHEMSDINIATKIQDVLEELELDIQAKNAVIKLENLPVVQGHERQLQQLFQNLISNALKYSHSDMPPQILITSDTGMEKGRPYHIIHVKDNGIGFEQEYAKKIFQMFTRLHGKNEYSGTGVGLSIVKKIAENHNGFVLAESALGEGSMFHVYLPILERGQSATPPDDL